MRIIHPSRQPPWRLAMRARTENFLHEFLETFRATMPLRAQVA